MTDEEKNAVDAKIAFVRAVLREGLGVAAFVAFVCGGWLYFDHTTKIENARLEVEKGRLVNEQQRVADFTMLAAAIKESTTTDRTLRESIEESTRQELAVTRELIEVLDADVKAQVELKAALIKALTEPRQIGETRSFEFPSRGRPIVRDPDDK